MKCKFQDNLEFMQWVKRYWEQYFPGGDYDAVGRRKGGGAPAKSPAAVRTRKPASAPAGKKTKFLYTHYSLIQCSSTTSKSWSS